MICAITDDHQQTVIVYISWVDNADGHTWSISYEVKSTLSDKTFNWYTR